MSQRGWRPKSVPIKRAQNIDLIIPIVSEKKIEEPKQTKTTNNLKKNEEIVEAIAITYKLDENHQFYRLLNKKADMVLIDELDETEFDKKAVIQFKGLL